MWTSPRTVWNMDWEGFLGHVDKKMIGNYPLNITAEGEEGCYGLSVLPGERGAEWKEVPCAGNDG
jgi:hypothetical protein